jgi:hypothetical protein
VNTLRPPSLQETQTLDAARQLLRRGVQKIFVKLFNFLSGLHSLTALRSVAVARKGCLSCNHAWLSVNETSVNETRHGHKSSRLSIVRDDCVVFVRFCRR